MSDPNVSLFDLDLARALSRSLSGEQPASTESPLMMGDDESFTRFSAERFLLARPAVEQPPVAVGVPEEEIPPPTPVHFDAWEPLLDWCLEVYPAHTAFVVEPEGFVIAHRGSWSFDHLEGVGPQLLTMTHSAQEIEEAGNVRFVSLEFESFWLTGLVATRMGMGDFIVAFLGSDRMTGKARNTVHTQVLHNLEHL